MTSNGQSVCQMNNLAAIYNMLTNVSKWLDLEALFTLVHNLLVRYDFPFLSAKRDLESFSSEIQNQVQKSKIIF